LCNKRLEREKKTITAMIELYCYDLHKPASGLCLDCADLLVYAEKRLSNCPYGITKPTCAKCITHCYKPFMRGQIQKVMRYAGPRMLKRHPFLTFWHIVDGLRSKRIIK